HGLPIGVIFILDHNRSGNIILGPWIADNLRHRQARLRQLRICLVVHRQRLHLIALECCRRSRANTDLRERIILLSEAGLTEKALGINRPPARKACHADRLALQILEGAKSTAFRQSNAKDVASLSRVIEFDRAPLLHRDHLAAGIRNGGRCSAPNNELYRRRSPSWSWKSFNFETFFFPETHLEGDRTAEREQ